MNNVAALFRTFRFYIFLCFTVLAYIGWRKFPDKWIEIIFLWGTFIFIIALWQLLKRHLSPTTFEERKDFIDLYAKIIGGSTLIVGLFFTWYGIKNTQKSLEESRDVAVRSLQVSNETLNNSRTNQLAERYARAVEQLGSDKIRVRIGVIYALERIASDAPDDHWRIMQVLTSYVRENAPWKLSNRNKPQEELPPDIEAVMNVLGRRRLTYMNGEGGKDQRLDLHQTDLRGWRSIEGDNFEGASFREANLEGSHIMKIRLRDAILYKASLKNTILVGADLKGADINGVIWDGADLTGVIGLPNSK